jgi:Nucleoside H+ symporter.
MNTATRVRLCVMMFLQYAVWGAWFVPFATYLSHHGLHEWIGTIYSAQGWAAIAAPLFVGVVADRLFAAEKVLGILQLTAGVLLATLTTIGANATQMFLGALGVLLAHMPTIAVSNTIALNAMTDPEREFPGIRVFGTAGWICAGLAVSFLLPGEAERTTAPILFAAVLALGYGAYAFTLPHSPPRGGHKARSVVALLGLDVMRHADRNFWTLVISSTLMMLPFSFYNVYANSYLDDIGVRNPAAIQTIGQVSEVLCVLLLPVLFRHIGIKGVLFIGMISWSIRYVAFAFAAGSEGPVMPLIYLGLALHGVGFDFVFVAATIWVGMRFTHEAQNRAQSFLALATWGVGYLIGSNVSNLTEAAASGTGNEHWQTFWLLPAAFAAVIAVLFALSFRSSTSPPTRG